MLFIIDNINKIETLKHKMNIDKIEQKQLFPTFEEFIIEYYNEYTASDQNKEISDKLAINYRFQNEDNCQSSVEPCQNSFCGCRCSNWDCSCEKSGLSAYNNGDGEKAFICDASGRKN